MLSAVLASTVGLLTACGGSRPASQDAGALRSCMRDGATRAQCECAISKAKDAGSDPQAAVRALITDCIGLTVDSKGNQ